MYTLHEYGQMLADEVRIRAYMGALRAAVRPGSVVLDIGTGPGIFAMEAARLGARRVFALDTDPVIEVGRETARRNKLFDRIEFIEADSTSIDLPERADVIVSDIRGALPLFSNHIPTIIDARTRHLREGGALIPAQDELFVALVDAQDRYRDNVGPWTHDVPDELAQVAAARLRHSYFGTEIKPSDLLSAPERWAVLDYSTIHQPNVEAKLELSVSRGGMGHGLGIWFVARLPGQLSYASGPTKDIPCASIYSSAFFPWLEPVPLDPGDRVGLRLRATLVDGNYQWLWDTQVRSGQDSLKAEFRQSTFYAAPFSAQTLKRRDAAHIPALGGEGRRLRFALSRMDGSQPLDSIAQELSQAFPTDFRSSLDALNYVARLSQKYGG
jgi:protein arginine N-methyltransferase 1